MGRSNKRPIAYQPESDVPQEQSCTASGMGSKTNATVIATDMTALGDLSGTGDVLIEGTVIGKITLHGTVTVARSGTVRGPVQADSVRVAGVIEGNIIAKECLHLEMTGSVKGDVAVSSFIIEDGGHFTGRSQMTKPGEEPVVMY